MASSGSGEVFQFGFDADGSLSPLAEPTVAADNSPSGVAVSPDGELVYVTTGDGVAQYDISSSGVLSPKTPPTVPAGQQPGSVAVSPDGFSVYVANLGGTVSQYNVGADGGLSPKAPATVAVPAPSGVAVSPDGQSVYVANDGTAAQNSNLVYQFDVGTGGTLSPKNPPAVAAGNGPSSVVVSPDGHSVYVTNSADDTVSQYDVGTRGALTLKSLAQVGAGDAPAQTALTPDGESAYVTNSGDPSVGGGSVSQYTVGAGGALAPKRPSTVSAGSRPTGIAVSLDGQSVYVTDSGTGGSNDGALYLFDVGNGAALSPEDPASLPAGVGPKGLAIRPPFATTQMTFNFTGGVQAWVVPGTVTSATFDLYGAEGGPSYPRTSSGNRAPGGRGAHVEATLAVTPGERFQILVGGMGGTSKGGFNGGGGLTTPLDAAYASGGGGGATDVRTGPGYGIEDRVLIAGGGGGGGGAGGTNGPAGGAGGASGAQGVDGADVNRLVPNGGGGGGHAGGINQPTLGGSGGQDASGRLPALSGTDGLFGEGGAAKGFSIVSGTGGGGGGGLVGGGGGGNGGEGFSSGPGSAGGGGGGGSSHIDSSATNTGMEDGVWDGNGTVTVAYFGPSAATCLGRPATIVAKGGGLTRGTPQGDVIVASSASDRIASGAGRDLVCSRGGDDVVSTGKGADRVSAGPGQDRIMTGSGADRVNPGSGRDRVRSGPGNDEVGLAGRARDRVDCGSGVDRAPRDRVDRLRRCERGR